MSLQRRLEKLEKAKYGDVFMIEPKPGETDEEAKERIGKTVRLENYKCLVISRVDLGRGVNVF